VHVTPAAIDWQHIPVLVDVPQTLKLSNESLIPAQFTADLVFIHSFVHSYSVSCNLLLECMVSLIVIAYCSLDLRP